MGEDNRIRLELKFRHSKRKNYPYGGIQEGRSELARLKKVVKEVEVITKGQEKTVEKLWKDNKEDLKKLIAKVEKHFKEKYNVKPTEASTEQEIEILEKELKSEELILWLRFRTETSELARRREFLEFYRSKIPKEEDKFIGKYYPSWKKSLRKLKKTDVGTYQDVRKTLLIKLKELGASEID